MSNYRRVYVVGGVYFFTLVTYRRRYVFVDDARVETLRSALRNLMEQRPFIIDAMVVLPDHVHCIWRLPPDDADYSSRWREVKKFCTRSLRAQDGAPLWQRRFWEHTIRDQDDWRRHLDYIHYNPVKHGYVSCAKDWRWSSFQNAVARGWYTRDWGCSEPSSIIGMNAE
ncbi:MAG: transposase [Halothiobacillaceae bacterium]|nr:transposase [Halothiobacillaceae bacterium]